MRKRESKREKTSKNLCECVCMHRCLYVWGGAGGDGGIMLECVCILECMHFHARICVCMYVFMYEDMKV